MLVNQGTDRKQAGGILASQGAGCLLVDWMLGLGAEALADDWEPGSEEEQDEEES